MPSTDDGYATLILRMCPFYMYGDPAVLAERFAHTVFRVRPMLEGFPSLATWSAVDRLGRLSMPVLVIAGDHDHFTSHQQSERIARLVRHAELHVLSDAGHFPWLEQPTEFFDVITTFLGV